MREIGEKLQARARELGLTDVEVARRLGLAQGRYSNYVNGNREPDVATFVRICRELAVTPNEVLGFGTETRHTKGVRSRIESLLDSFSLDNLELALAILAAVRDHARTSVTGQASQAFLPASGKRST